MRGPDADAPTAMFVLEQTLGHVTHAANLRMLVGKSGRVEPVFVPVPFDTSGSRVPLWSNWTVRAGLRAAGSIVRLSRSGVRADVMFVHTQVPAVLLGPWMHRTPTVVSLDATPEQYDQLGEFYAHKQGPRLVERVKHGLNRRCFERAAHLITWSEWARQGLMRDYGIAPEQVTAIAPGVDLGRWQRPENRQGGDDGVVRILFVGSDLQRKGGDQLLAAIRALRRVVREPRVELHLVTTATVEAEPGVVVHSGVSPNSPELIRLYQTADIFCLPTLGDCLPMVLAEAAASGLPLISTDVGAIHEIVRTGVTGQLVPAGNVEALVEALRTLVVDSALRMRLGGAARRLAEQDHDASANTEMVIDILLKQIDSRVTVSTE